MAHHLGSDMKLRKPGPPRFEGESFTARMEQCLTGMARADIPAIDPMRLIQRLAVLAAEGTRETMPKSELRELYQQALAYADAGPLDRDVNPFVALARRPACVVFKVKSDAPAWKTSDPSLSFVEYRKVRELLALLHIQRGFFHIFECVHEVGEEGDALAYECTEPYDPDEDPDPSVADSNESVYERWNRRSHALDLLCKKIGRLEDALADKNVVPEGWWIIC